MSTEQMQQLIEQHLAAELAGDPDAAVVMYTDDVVHDVVGSPTGPLQGPEAAKAFYDNLIANVAHDRLRTVREWFGEDFAVVEHVCDGRVTGEFLGIPGHGREVSFRMLHVWEFKDGAMCRENIWLDGGAIAAQLTADAA